jgi:E3 ubiquitin-protein ligase HUWE1
MPKDTKDRGSGTSGASTSTATAASTSSVEDSASEVISNFWQVLLKLDGAASRKGKGALKSFQYSESSSHWQENEMFSASIMGQLMALFQNDLIRTSVTLTDKLLRALSVASSAIPKAGLKRRQLQQGDRSANLTITAAPGNNTNSVTMIEASRVTVPSAGKSLFVSRRTESEDVFETAKIVESSLVDPPLVKVLVGVLTSGRCSEDGLEDATVLLTNLSKCSVLTRELILITLLDGVKTCGQTLCSQISNLFEDLILNMQTLKKRRKSAPDPSGAVSENRGELSAEPVRSSTVPNRFGALAGVVLPSVTHEQQHVDRSKDLHLPAMLPLHCKGSQQSFFLRMLKVVCQLRESAQAAFAAQKRAKLLADVQVVPQSVPDVPPAASSSSGGEGGRGEGEGPREVPTDRGDGEQQQPQQEQRQEQDMDTSQTTTEENAATTTTQSEGGEPSSSSSSSQQVTQSQSQNQAEGATAVAATPTPITQQTQEPESDESQQDRFVHQSLSHQLELDDLWGMLSECLSALAETQDPHAVLVLQPSVEAFFLVHADHSEEVKQQLKKRSSTSIPRSGRLSSFHTITDTESNPASPAPALFDALSPVPGTPSDADFDPYAHLPPDTVRFLKFAEKHRTVLNQILRQSTIPLSEGPFAVLVNHTRVLDFDIKRRYFRHELDQMEDGLRRDDVVLHIRRDHIFEDSFRELYRRTADELKGNLYIQFQGEEGQDVGGLLREWYLIMAREMFNPNYALFKLTPGDQVTYMPNPSSHVNPNHLDYFKFIGRVIAKAIYDNKLLDAYFTRSFYKHILGKPVHFTDMEAEDYTFYQSMLFLLEHNLKDLGLELTFSMEVCCYLSVICAILITHQVHNYGEFLAPSPNISICLYMYMYTHFGHHNYYTLRVYYRTSPFTE